MGEMFDVREREGPKGAKILYVVKAGAPPKKAAGPRRVPLRQKGDVAGVRRSFDGQLFELQPIGGGKLMWKKVKRGSPPPRNTKRVSAGGSASRRSPPSRRSQKLAILRRRMAARKIARALKKRATRRAAAAESFDVDLFPDVPGVGAKKPKSAGARKPKRRVSRIRTRSMRSKSFRAKIAGVVSKARQELEAAKRSIHAAQKSKVKGIKSRLEGAQELIGELDIARGTIRNSARESLKSQQFRRIYRDANEVKRLARNARELAKSIRSVSKSPKRGAGAGAGAGAAAAGSLKSLTQRLNALKAKAESLKKKQAEHGGAAPTPKTKGMIIAPSCIQYVLKAECREKMCAGVQKKKSSSPRARKSRSASRSRSASASPSPRSRSSRSGSGSTSASRPGPNMPMRR
jgi:hypothetical protein